MPKPAKKSSPDPRLSGILDWLHGDFLEIIDTKRQNKKPVNPHLIAAINPLSCMAYHRDICAVCKDICPQHIAFSGAFYPRILSSCTACGRCTEICPSEAITLKTRTKNEHL